MFFYIVKWSIVYLILIFLLHNLYIFFEKNLTTTKTKDFFNYPNKEYNKINDILSSNIKNNENIISNNFNNLNNNVNNANNDNNSNNIEGINNIKDLNKEFNISNFNNMFENGSLNINHNDNHVNDNHINDNHVNDNAMKNELNDFLSKLNSN